MKLSAERIGKRETDEGYMMKWNGSLPSLSCPRWGTR